MTIAKPAGSDRDNGRNWLECSQVSSYVNVCAPRAGNIQVPGHIGGLLELRLGEAGEQADALAGFVGQRIGS